MTVLGTRACSQCGADYAPRRRDQRYCSRPCASKFLQRKYRREHPWYRSAELQRLARWSQANSDRVAEVRRQRQMMWNSALATYKLEQGCVDCGTAWALSVGENPDALEFDHVDPTTKVFSLGNKRRVGEAVLLAELAKCVVRCANCHTVRSAQQARSRREEESCTSQVA